MIKMMIFLLMIGMVLVSGVEAKDTGKSRAAFLKIGVGARVAAMGEAFCALSDDISAIYWNPAGLSQLTQTEIMATHLSYFQDVNSEYLAFVRPNKNKGALGGALTMLGVDGLKWYDKHNARGNDFKANDMAMSLVYSKMFGQGAAIGAGLKLVKQGIDNKDTDNLVVDLGGLCNTPIRNLVVGAVVQNIGIKASDKKRGEVDDPMPFRMRLGLSYQLPSSTICVDMNMPNDGQRTTNIGIEQTLPKEVAPLAMIGLNTVLRAGYKMGADTGKFSFGFGIISNKCLLDYAFVPYSDLGNAHRVSTSLRFGSPKPKQRVSLLLETKEKKKEPMVSWISVQRFALGMFIEERNFPEHLKKKKDDKKKMPVLPGINTPSETAKGTATPTEAAEVKKVVDFDKAADEIDFDADEETTVSASENVEEPQGTATTASSPQATASDAAAQTPASGNVEKPQGTATTASSPQTTASDAAAQTPVSGNVEKPQGTVTAAGSPQATAETAAATAGSPQAKVKDANAVDKTTPSDVKQGVANGNELKNAASTHFKFMDIAPIDDGEVMD